MSASDAGERPTAYAIVVNYNGWADTIECVDSLLRGDHQPLRVVVLDNASRDDSVSRLAGWLRERRVSAATLSRAEFEHGGWPGNDGVVLVTCGANLGFAGANNVALRWMLANDPSAYALLLNNDAVIAPDGLRRMIECARAAPDAGAAGATVLRHDRPDEVEMLAGATVHPVSGMIARVHAGAPRNAPRPAAPRLDFVSGTCLLVSGATLRRVGVMDERFFLYGEDVDWGLRMRRAGLRLLYCPDAEVWHKGGATITHHSALHDYYLVRAALVLARKHTPHLLPLTAGYWIWRGVLPKLVRGEWSRLRAVVRGYRDFILGR